MSISRDQVRRMAAIVGPPAEEPLYEEEPEGEDERPEPSEEDLEMFRQQVSQWLKLDDQVRKLSIAIRERRTQQRSLAERISTFMQTYGYDNLNTQAGRIRTMTRKVRAPLRINDVRQKIEELGATGPVAATDIITRIFDAERPTTTRTSLRRIIPRVSMSLDL